MILLPHLHESSGGRDSTSNMAALGRIYVYIYLYIYIYIHIPILYYFPNIFQIVLKTL